MIFFYSLLGAAACEQLIRTSLSIVEVLSQHHAVISPHHSVVSTTGRLFVTYLSAFLVDSAVVCPSTSAMFYSIFATAVAWNVSSVLI